MVTTAGREVAAIDSGGAADGYVRGMHGWSRLQAARDEVTGAVERNRSADEGRRERREQNRSGDVVASLRRSSAKRGHRAGALVKPGRENRARTDSRRARRSGY